MMNRANYLTFTLLLTLSGCGGGADTPLSLEGIYNVVSCEEGGVPTEKSILKSQAMVVDDMFSLYDDNNRRTMKFQIDSSKRPKHLDLEWDGLNQPGIYEIKGDELKVCYDQDGKNRPKEFSSPAGSNTLLLLLKKEPSEQ